MDLNQQKEQFSNVFVHAAAAVSGFATSKPDVDDDSIDWTISARRVGGALISPKLDLQLKCTATPTFDTEFLRYPLPLKNYDDLRPTNLQVPRILVVVTVPQSIEEWLSLDEASLCLRKCAYWVSLRGSEPTTNEASVTVRLPRAQTFDPAALTSMMERIASRSPP